MSNEEAADRSVDRIEAALRDVRTAAVHAKRTLAQSDHLLRLGLDHVVDLAGEMAELHRRDAYELADGNVGGGIWEFHDRWRDRLAAVPVADRSQP